MTERSIRKAIPRILLSPPYLGTQEFHFVCEAFESNYIAPLGPQVNAFEKEFSDLTGVPHAAALSSGTAAIHLALDLLGVGPGDEVFASTLTFIGSVSPITFLGGTPVFIDADPETWNLSPDLLADALYAKLENLFRLAEQQDTCGIKSALSELVPEYHCQDRSCVLDKKAAPADPRKSPRKKKGYRPAPGSRGQTALDSLRNPA